MRASISAANLAQAVRVTSTAISGRPHVPILAGVKITVRHDEVTFAGFDLDTSATCTIKASATSDGSVVVSHRLLAQITSTIKRGDVTLDLDGPLVVTANRATWRLPVMSHEDYPEIPTAIHEVARVSGGSLADAISRVAPAASEVVEMNPPLDVVYLGLSDGLISVAALDRFRMHSHTISADCVVEAFVLIPAQAAASLAKHLPDGEVIIRRTDGLLELVAEGTTMATRIADSSQGWNDWRTLLATSQTNTRAHVEIDRSELVDALRQVGSFAETAAKNTRHLILRFDAHGELTIAAGSDAEGAGSAVVPTQHDGPGIQLVVNVVYLSEALATCASSTVAIGFGGPRMPITLADGSRDPEVILMPVGAAASATWLDEAAA